MSSPRLAKVCDECEKPLEEPVTLKPSEFILCARCYSKLERDTIIQPGVKREKA